MSAPLASVTRSTRAPEHYPALDGLRTVAVAAVLWTHTVGGMLGPFDLGAAGVQLFFVLSGFLITQILLRARTDAGGADRGWVLRAFYARRFLRIFPIYYLALGLAWLAAMPTVRERLWWYVSYLYNWKLAALGHWTTGAPEHVWSLAVEEQFYLVWPLLLLTVPRRHLRSVLVGTVALAFLTRAALYVATHNTIAMTAVTPAALDYLGAGAVLAWAWQSYGPDNVQLLRWLDRLAVAGTLLALALLVLRDHAGGYGASLILSGAALAPVFAWAIHRSAIGRFGWAGALLATRPMTYIGRISYGVYLYHGFLRWPLHDVLQPLPPVVRFLVLSAVAIAVSALSWHLIESPLTRYKSRWPYRRPRPDYVTDHVTVNVSVPLET